MKYNKSFSDGDFEDYKKYLETVKDKMPQTLYDFVSDSKRHNLEEQSLHDSWVNEINIKEIRDKENRFRSVELVITIELLGPYHDRIFELKFNKVQSYRLDVGRSGHCDLITYEIYCETFYEEDFMVFNAEFADESVFIIEAKEISIIENLFPET